MELLQEQVGRSGGRRVRSSSRRHHKAGTKPAQKLLLQRHPSDEKPIERLLDDTSCVAKTSCPELLQVDPVGCILRLFAFEPTDPWWNRHAHPGSFVQSPLSRGTPQPPAYIETGKTCPPARARPASARACRQRPAATSRQRPAATSCCCHQLFFFLPCGRSQIQHPHSPPRPKKYKEIFR